MFDISWGELILIGMVALIVIGPKELPTVIRTVGQWMTKIRRMASEFQGQFQDAMREAEFADLKKTVDSIGDPAKSFTDFNPLDTAKTEIEKAFEDKPAPAPTPDIDPLPVSADAPPVPPAEASAPPAEAAAPEPAAPPSAPEQTTAAPAPATPAEGGRAA